MRFVLNLPLPSYQGEQALGGGPLRAQARDSIDHFHPFLACFGEHDVASKLKDLRQPRPVAVAYQCLTRGDIALLDAPMPAVHRVGGCLLVARGGQRKDSLNIGPELRLIVFDDHDIIAAFVHNGLRHVALRQERVHRDNTAFQD